MTSLNSGVADWLPEARGGSREALGQVLEACRGYLLVVAGQELAPDLRAKGGASDLVQETFIEAQKDFGRFQGSSEAELLAWLRCVLMHRLANFTRRYRKTHKRRVGQEVDLYAGGSSTNPAANLPAGTLTPSAQLMAGEQLQALQQTLERMPPDYRQVIALRYQEQLSFDEIGQHMGRSAEAARKLWWRALGRMQTELESVHEPGK